MACFRFRQCHRRVVPHCLSDHCLDGPYLLIHSASATQQSQRPSSVALWSVFLFLSDVHLWVGLLSHIISLCLAMWARMTPKVAARATFPFRPLLTFMWLFNTLNSSSYDVVGFTIGGLWYKARFPILTDFVSLEEMCVVILLYFFYFCHLFYYWAECLHKCSRCKSLRTYVQKQEQVFSHADGFSSSLCFLLISLQCLLKYESFEQPNLSFLVHIFDIIYYNNYKFKENLLINFLCKSLYF